MGDLYNIFSKKKIDQPKITSFKDRFKQCLKRTEEIGWCDCALCEDKTKMSERLYDIVRYLCKDYAEKTGNKLYVADAFEIALMVALKLKKEIRK